MYSILTYVFSIKKKPQGEENAPGLSSTLPQKFSLEKGENKRVD